MHSRISAIMSCELMEPKVSPNVDTPYRRPYRVQQATCAAYAAYSHDPTSMTVCGEVK